jgi:predicted ATP-grasp superfamily ATP-dependent carboligase
LKILIVEYVTGGGLRREPIPPALAREGDQMLRALTRDLLALPDAELVVLRDDRFELVAGHEAMDTVYVGEGDDFDLLWLTWLARCDAVWPIAPETGGLLERLCREAEHCGKALLGSPASAVRLAASKLATARRLRQSGLPVVPTAPLRDWVPSPPPDAVVTKPDDGVGCEGARILWDSAGIEALKVEPGAEGRIAQPLLEGEPLSLSILFARGEARLLSCNRQFVARTHDTFTLRGCRVNALPDDSGVWQSLADAIARAVPELWGYAGVDLVLTAAGPVIMEINPRLTTSYAGLYEATGENVAALVLDLLATGELPPPRAFTGRPVQILWQDA